MAAFGEKRPMFDLVLRGGTIIDGTGAPGRRGDVAVADGVIVETGQDLGRGREEIDARGRIVSPGFIDCHTHDDLALLVDPDMTAKISQGVTTCVCGNCGVSIAPVPLDRMAEGRLPEPLNLISPRAGCGFEAPGDYLDALRDRPAAVNSVPLVGHTALRACVMDRFDRPASDREVAAMAALLDEALAAGFHGVSTGTYYAGAASASAGEIIAALAPLRTRGGVFATHMRDENDGVLASIEETAAIARALGAVTVISHHKVAGVANYGRSRETLARLKALQAELPIVIDAYPYVAGSTVLRADRVAVAERALISDCPADPSAAGRDVAELARERGLSVEALCEALSPAGAIYFMMSEADVEAILAFDGAMIGSDGIPLQSRPHPRLWGAFARVLGRYSRDRGLFPLETAVARMTGVTARRFGLSDRGLVCAGMAADLVVFDAGAIADRATFEDPARPAAGIDCVIVNGRVGWRDGRVEAHAGRLLPRGAPRI